MTAPSEESVEYPLTAEMLTLGRKLITLAETSRTWISRRIEQIAFEDHQTISRTTTLDLSFGGEEVRANRLPEWRGRLLLPVKLLRREVDDDATVLDVSGVAMPQLTQRHERTLVAAGLAALASSTDTAISDILELARKVRTTLVPQWFPGEGIDVDSLGGETSATNIKRFMNHLFLVAALDRDLIGAAGGVCRVSVAQSGLVPFLEQRVERLPPRARLDRSARRLRHPVKVWRRYVAAELSDRDLAVVQTDDLATMFAVDELAGCESFHIELAAPPGGLLKFAELTVETFDSRRFEDSLVADTTVHVSAAATSSTETGSGARKEEVIIAGFRIERFRDDDLHHDRAHMFCSVSADERVVSGSVTALLRPMTMGTTRAGMYSVVLATAALVLLFMTIGWNGAPDRLSWTRVVDGRYDPDDYQSIVALLLLGPTLFLASLIREKEHLMTKRLLERHRRRLMAQAVLTLVTAFTYGVGTQPEARWWLSLPMVVASLFVTGIEVRSYGRSWRTLKAQARVLQSRLGVPIGQT